MSKGDRLMFYIVAQPWLAVSLALDGWPKYVAFGYGAALTLYGLAHAGRSST